MGEGGNWLERGNWARGEIVLRGGVWRGGKLIRSHSDSSFQFLHNSSANARRTEVTEGTHSPMFPCCVDVVIRRPIIEAA